MISSIVRRAECGGILLNQVGNSADKSRPQRQSGRLEPKNRRLKTLKLAIHIGPRSVADIGGILKLPVDLIGSGRGRPDKDNKGSWITRTVG